MERNQARLQEWQEIPRTWDERFGYVQRPMPLLPWVCTAVLVATILGLCWMINRLW